jgi:hypothetical protein
MLTFTLDTNCLIAVEQQRLSEAPAVEQLVRRHRAGEVVVRLVATTAAENQLDGTMASNFSYFQQRMRGLGLDDLEILRPVCCLDLSYSDWCVIGHDTTAQEVEQLHTILFPTAQFSYQEAVPYDLDDQARAAAERKWRNRQLDVLILHTHIQARGDVFVTSDANYRKLGKAARLAALGARTVLAPADAAIYGLLSPPTPAGTAGQ